MPNSHHAHVYRSLEQLLLERSSGDDKSRRFWTKKWKNHVEKHGNVPFITKCSICSGQEQKHDVKVGRWRLKRPNKAERQEHGL